jgi:large subunit ribosomal protein L18
MTRQGTKLEKRLRRHRRVRSVISGSSVRPRLSVYRSSKHIYAQLIDDDTNKTLFGLADFGMKGNKSERSNKVGEGVAKKAIEKGIKKIVFDRGGYLFHGRIKEVAEGVRKAGIII